MNRAGESRPGSFYGVKIPARSERMVRARSETHLLPDLSVGFMDAIAARADRISQAREFRRNTFCSSTFLFDPCPSLGRTTKWRKPLRSRWFSAKRP